MVFALHQYIIKGNAGVLQQHSICQGKPCMSNKKPHCFSCEAAHLNLSNFTVWYSAAFFAIGQFTMQVPQTSMEEQLNCTL